VKRKPCLVLLWLYVVQELDALEEGRSSEGTCGGELTEACWWVFVKSSAVKLARGIGND
jgi:hypothetical protein